MDEAHSPNDSSSTPPTPAIASSSLVPSAPPVTCVAPPAKGAALGYPPVIHASSDTALTGRHGDEKDLQSRLRRLYSNDMTPPLVTDYIFRCSHCIKLIAEDSDVYMLDDHCYCSYNCREKGLSRLYTNLREVQLRGTLAGPLATSLAHKSDSSISYTLDSASSVDDHWLATQEQVTPLLRFGMRVADVLVQWVADRPWGAQILRTYSSSMLWGREMVKDSSASTLLDFLPQVDHYIDGRLSKSSSYADSPHARSSCGEMHTTVA